jgi:hypothetical protein
MGEMRNVYKILVGKHEGKPEHSWVDSINHRHMGYENVA